MDFPNNTSLPFFAYGAFKPKQLGFYRIADCVERVENDCTIPGALLERDGLPIVDEEGNSEVSGSLISFKPDSVPKAYQGIVEIEPDNHYRWGAANVHKGNADIDANVLLPVNQAAAERVICSFANHSRSNSAGGRRAQS